MNTLSQCGTVRLETERLTLKRIPVSDCTDMFQNFAGDERVARYMSWNTFRTQADVSQWLAEWQEEYQKLDTYYWGIYLSSQDKIIGTIYLLTEDERSLTASVSFCLGYDYWGNGYMAEALCAVIGYAFEKIGLGRIEAYHAESNLQSARVLQKAGMKKEGVLRCRCKTFKGFENAVYYSVLRKEYSECYSFERFVSP